MHVTGIDDFDDVGVSLFSAFNMLVLGVFQIDTVRSLLWRCLHLFLPFVCGAVYQVWAEPGRLSSAVPVFDGFHSNRSPKPPHW